MKHTPPLDGDILNFFDNTLTALNITDEHIQSLLYDLDLPRLDKLTRDKLAGDGLEVAQNFDDDSFEIMEFEQFLTYGKRFVVLYIKDQYLRKDKYLRGDLKPFHICWYQALQDAKAQHRYEERYVMTYNTGGSFKVNLYVRDIDASGRPYTEKKEQNIYRKLRVCQSCLHHLNWQNFRRFCAGGVNWWKGGDPQKRMQIAVNFDLAGYLSDAKNAARIKAAQDILYSHPVNGTGESATKKEYVLTPEIKEALKKLVGYTCEMCHKPFSAKDLQIHHKNHNEGDNRRENLLVICQACHSLIHDAEGGFTNKTTKNSTKGKIETTKEISEQEYADAINSLLTIYKDGLGTTKNGNKAAELEEMLNECENKNLTELKEINPAQENLYKLRAENGDASAYFTYAEILKKEADNIESANYWYKKAAEYSEKVVEEFSLNQSPDKLKEKADKGSEAALKRLKKLAENGNVDAMLALAELYGG